MLPQQSTTSMVCLALVGLVLMVSVSQAASVNSTTECQHFDCNTDAWRTSSCYHCQAPTGEWAYEVPAVEQCFERYDCLCKASKGTLKFCKSGICSSLWDRCEDEMNTGEDFNVPA